MQWTGTDGLKITVADESTTDEEKDILRTSIDQLNAKIGENIGNDLCYETGAQGDVVATMISENSWSKKLVGCV